MGSGILWHTLAYSGILWHTLAYSDLTTAYPPTDDCCGDLGVCGGPNGTCDLDTTCCPSGCCPEPNWFCCPDWYCAATAGDCAIASKRQKLFSWVRGPLGWTSASKH